MVVGSALHELGRCRGERNSYSGRQTSRAQIGCRGCAARVLGAGAGAKNYDCAGASESSLDSIRQTRDVSRLLHRVLRHPARLDALFAWRPAGGGISEMETSATSCCSAAVE